MDEGADAGAGDAADGRVSFPEEEEKVLRYWEEIDAFATSLKLSEGRPEYTFYDGPPFATGLPHFGHILAGTIKDTVTRYAHQTGHHVVRRFGWDCHGLPVEYEIDQALGIRTRDQVLEMGIGTYNDHCRGIVQRYTGEWEKTVRRLGRWIDFKNDYKTMDPWFMESVWWVFKQLFDKGLVYRGVKVMPYSTKCATPLSNFEAGQNYKDVRDPAVVVSFSLTSDPEVSFLAWTTTPWTLPSNLALCVNPTFEYVKIRDVKSGRLWVLLKDRLAQVYPVMATSKWKPEKAGELYEVLQSYKGEELVGLSYTPLFPYFQDLKGAFRVISDGYVTAEGGTGIVHQAPAFGEDDYRVCLTHGVVQKGMSLPCPVDADGNFTNEVPDFVGRHVKEADSDICAKLKAEGRLISKEVYDHSYPFCWRSDTPLIYKAVPSWFVAVERIKEKLLVNNAKTYWVPANVKEKRFHNWLADAKDWAISRNRFWGTPIPLWVSEDFEEVVAVGSVEELFQLSGHRATDLHRENIDHITIPSRQGKGQLRRVEEVFDCWFESGSMPYAQLHYPFENRQRFEGGFPADFIAEGLDQTRGWFYTLTVIATALFDQPAFKNLVVNGLVLASDGKKMSKRLKNYPDPNNVVSSHGADALRLYLINSPVVRAEPLRFREDGVVAVVREVFLPWFNAYRFLSQQVRRWELATQQRFAPDAAVAAASGNAMDVWVQASLQGLVKFVHEEMEAYRLYTVVPRLVSFIEDLTNWYVRLNRKRLKGDEGDQEARTGLCCLYEVLLTMSVVMAPFTPFFAEFLYQRLRKLHPAFSGSAAAAGAGAEGAAAAAAAAAAAGAAATNGGGSSSGGSAVDALGSADSVHYLMLPRFDPARLDPEAEADTLAMQRVIELGRTARDKRNVSLKTPVKEVIVICKDAKVLSGVQKLMGYVKSELNAWEVRLTEAAPEWCSLSAQPDMMLVGRRLGKKAAAVQKAVKALSEEDVAKLEEAGRLEIAGEVLEGEELHVRRAFKGDAEAYEAAWQDGGSGRAGLMVVVDIRKDDRVRLEHLARSLVTKVQKLRKKAGLQVGDAVEAFFDDGSADGSVAAAVAANLALVRSVLAGATPLPALARPPHAVTIAEDRTPLEGSSLSVELTLPALSLDSEALEAAAGAAGVDAAAPAWLLASMDCGRLRAAAEAKGARSEVVAVFDGKEVALRHGEHYFWDALEALRSRRDKRVAWALPL